MMKAIFGFALRPGKSMAAYRRHFAASRAPAILANPYAPVSLSLLWASRPVALPGAAKSAAPAYEILSMNGFRDTAHLTQYSHSPQFQQLTADGATWVSDAQGCLMEEVVHWDEAPACRDGQVQPGFKLLFFMRRKPGIAQAVFEKHYREVHAPLARQHHPALIAYTQNFLRSHLMGDHPACDAIVELRFSSRQDLRQRFYATPASADILMADAVQFIDMASLQVLTVEETCFRARPA